MLAGALWELNLDLAEACLATPFVAALRDGAQTPDALARFEAQEAILLGALRQACTVAAGRLDGKPDHVAVLQRQYPPARVAGLHLVDDAPVAADDDALPCVTTYVQFLRETAWHDNVGETLAAITPHVRIAAYIGQALREQLTPEHAHRDWIRQRSDRAIEARAGELEKLLSTVAADDTAIRVTYRYAMQCELDCLTAASEAAT